MTILIIYILSVIIVFYTLTKLSINEIIEDNNKKDIDYVSKKLKEDMPVIIGMSLFPGINIFLVIIIFGYIVSEKINKPFNNIMEKISYSLTKFFIKELNWNTEILKRIIFILK